MDYKEYIAKQNKEVREILESIELIVEEIAPDAVEKMGYGVLEFNLNGPLIYIGAFQKHIGLYPASSNCIDKLKKELTGYKASKGTIQFRLDKPIPYELIKKIVKLRTRENLAKSN